MKPRPRRPTPWPSGRAERPPDRSPDRRRPLAVLWGAAARRLSVDHHLGAGRAAEPVGGLGLLPALADAGAARIALVVPRGDGGGGGRDQHLFLHHLRHARHLRRDRRGPPWC
ncbi:MAG: hypothetical protein WDN45_01145 [Caulobacteraceae bacterium]